MALRAVSARRGSPQGQPWDPGQDCDLWTVGDLPTRQPRPSRSPTSRTSTLCRPGLEPVLGLADAWPCWALPMPFEIPTLHARVDRTGL